MKKLFIIFTIFVLIINNQIVFATNKNTPEYIANKTNFFDTKTSYQNIKENNFKNQPWYLSFIFPGLGQFVMGDFERGKKYTFSFSLVTIIIALIYYPQSQNNKNLSYTPRLNSPTIFQYFVVFLGYIYILILPIIYVFSVIDSYNFYLEKNNYLEKNPIKVSYDGIYYTLASF